MIIVIPAARDKSCNHSIVSCRNDWQTLTMISGEIVLTSSNRDSILALESESLIGLTATEGEFAAGSFLFVECNVWISQILFDVVWSNTVNPPDRYHNRPPVICLLFSEPGIFEEISLCRRDGPSLGILRIGVVFLADMWYCFIRRSVQMRKPVSAGTSLQIFFFYLNMTLILLILWYKSFSAGIVKLHDTAKNQKPR